VCVSGHMQLCRAFKQLPHMFSVPSVHTNGFITNASILWIRPKANGIVIIVRLPAPSEIEWSTARADLFLFNFIHAINYVKTYNTDKCFAYPSYYLERNHTGAEIYCYNFIRITTSQVSLLVCGVLIHCNHTIYVFVFVIYHMCYSMRNTWMDCMGSYWKK